MLNKLVPELDTRPWENGKSTKPNGNKGIQRIVTTSLQVICIQLVIFGLGSLGGIEMVIFLITLLFWGLQFHKINLIPLFDRRNFRHTSIQCKSKLYCSLVRPELE